MSSITSKLERVVSNTLGPGADTSKDKDGGKDTNKDSGKDATNKDTNKDKDKDNNTTKAGALTTESGANRGTPENINTSVSAQKSDLIDLQKGEELSGKQSPTPKTPARGGKGWKK